MDFLEEVRGRHHRHIVFFPILRMGTNQLAAEDPKDCSLACTTHHHVRYYAVVYHRVQNSINLQLHIAHVLTYFKLVDLFVL